MFGFAFDVFDFFIGIILFCHFFFFPLLSRGSFAVAFIGSLTPIFTLGLSFILGENYRKIISGHLCF